MNDGDLGINEYEALAFFGGDPVSRVFGEQWFDSDSVYEAKDKNGLTLTCATHPIHRDVRLRLLMGDSLIYEWQARISRISAMWRGRKAVPSSLS